MHLIHCSYHKCLTVFFKSVMGAVITKGSFGARYQHYNSLIDDFYKNLDDDTISSVNNHSLDLTRIGENYRISRFIRDPRDLVVSGYFYHRKGSEPWCNIKSPGPDDFKVVNGVPPKQIPQGQSFSEYLQSIPIEQGLIEEIKFRKNHFDSMRQWPNFDPNIKTYRYEDIIGNEKDVFSDILQFYGMQWPKVQLGKILANRYSANSRHRRSKHIRDPSSGQWEKYFSNDTYDYFKQHFGDILSIYGYPR